MSETKESGACFCGAIIADMRGDPFGFVTTTMPTGVERLEALWLCGWAHRPEQVSIIQGNPKSFLKPKA